MFSSFYFESQGIGEKALYEASGALQTSRLTELLNRLIEVSSSYSRSSSSGESENESSKKDDFLLI